MLRVWERALDIHNVFVCEGLCIGWDTIIIDLVQESLNRPDGYMVVALCILVQDFVGFLWVFNLIGCMIHVTAQRRKAHFKGRLD